MQRIRKVFARTYALGGGKPESRSFKGRLDSKEVLDVENKLEGFKNPKPRNYVGQSGENDIPFPTNPFFKAEQPLSEKTRMTIYNLFKQSPAKWTPRSLAEQFRISIGRVEAILRLKSLEANNIQKGIAAQTDYVKGMEVMLNPLTIPYLEGETVTEQYEPIRETKVQGLNPFIQLLDEEDCLTPEDAAKILHLEPYENISKRLSVKANRIFVDKAPQSPPAEPIAKDATLGGKNEFMIVDTSKPKAPEIVIRNREGNLLPATPAQIYLKRHAKPKNFTM